MSRGIKQKTRHPPRRISASCKRQSRRTLAPVIAADPMHSLSRKAFLKRAAWTAAAFSGAALGAYLKCGRGAVPPGRLASGYGPLKADPRGLLDLPAGFSYSVISRSGTRMADQRFVPRMPDAMGAFPASNGRTLLLRNHELEHSWWQNDAALNFNSGISANERELFYDAGQPNGPPAPGGVTSLLFDEDQGRVDAEWLSLAGTVRNCSGGPTPEGAWISCEESVERGASSQTNDGYAQDHGYAFEVRASEIIELQAARPLRAMGRFRREAVALDPASGIVYQTEDRPDGLIYRFVPDTPGRLADGGSLQALAIQNAPGLNTSNRAGEARDRLRPGVRLPVRWLNLDQAEAPDDDLRYRGHALGAARFARGEGMYYGKAAVYFTATTGGPNGRGQIWRYFPATQELELFLEPDESAVMDMPDNISFAPNGDLLVCEDNRRLDNYLLGVTPAGGIYRLAHNVGSRSEFAGAVFSPGGQTLFVNLQADGLTLAIRGPFATRRA